MNMWFVGFVEGLLVVPIGYLLLAAIVVSWAFILDKTHLFFEVGAMDFYPYDHSGGKKLTVKSRLRYIWSGTFYYPGHWSSRWVGIGTDKWGFSVGFKKELG